MFLKKRKDYDALIKEEQEKIEILLQKIQSAKQQLEKLSEKKQRLINQISTLKNANQ